jgi:hypothetical protein
MDMVVEAFNVAEVLPFLLGKNADQDYPLLSQALEIVKNSA